MTDLKKLRELAGRTTFTKVDSTDSYSDLWLCYATEPDTSSGEFIAEFASKADADYFAAANPETVIALIDRIEKLERIAQDFTSHSDDCALLYSYDDENVKCNCGLQLALEQAEVP